MKMILESREATKKYGSKTAVNQVSLQLEPGLVYAMLGPNGSGKTTWMKMVAGLVKRAGKKLPICPQSPISTAGCPLRMWENIMRTFLKIFPWRNIDR